ncbi:hypothetical protein HDU88_004753 [Geranomyces variabilis]|nr:hypothetical protein HDU88_004753 [Geranomyces variabilis]
MPSAELAPPSRFKTMRDIFDAMCGPGDFSCINLAAGMVELPPPQTLTRVAAELVQRNKVEESFSRIGNPHMYRSRTGDRVYIEAIQKLQKKIYKTGTYSPDMILATSGVSGAFSSTLATIANRAGGTAPLRCGLFVPYYTYHLEAIKTMLPADTSIVFMPLKDDMSFDLDLLAQEAPGLDLIAFTNPGNPSCHALTKEEVLGIELIAAANPKMTVFSDEIYADIMYGAQFHSFGPSTPANILVARGFSKILSVGSWRLAYVLGHPDTLAGVATAHDRIFVGVNVTQMAVGVYIRDHFDDFLQHIAEFNKILASNAEIICEAFEKNLGWTLVSGQGSMYRLIRHNLPTDEAAFDLLVDSCGIAVVPGSLMSPGSSAGYLRIHVGYAKTKAEDVCNRLAMVSSQA